jgi:hypothetical protein
MAKREEIDQIADECYPDAEILLLEPRDLYDNSFVGICEKFVDGGHVAFAVYDEDKLIDDLAASYEEDELGEDDDPYTMAREHFDFNIRGAYVGPNGPAFVRVLD